MSRCSVCGARCERQVEPACGELPSVTEPDVWIVALRNGLYVDACQRCWGLWPDEHKVFPAVGFGRWPDDEPQRAHISIEELVELVGPA